MLELVSNLDQPNPRADIPDYVLLICQKPKTHKPQTITIDYKMATNFCPPCHTLLQCDPATSPCIWAWPCDLANRTLENVMQTEVCKVLARWGLFFMDALGNPVTTAV